MRTRRTLTHVHDHCWGSLLLSRATGQYDFSQDRSVLQETRSDTTRRASRQVALRKLSKPHCLEDLGSYDATCIGSLEGL